MKNTNYRLFLDDIRMPIEVFAYKQNKIYKEHWFIIRNFNQFVDLIEKNYAKHKILPIIISFDHDLADFHYTQMNNGEIDYSDVNEKTGYHCAKWLVNFCIERKLEIPNYLVHSMNIVGSKNIESYIESAKRFLN